MTKTRTPITPDKVIVIDHLILSSKRPDRRYRGMNWWAAQELESAFPHPKDTVVITKRSEDYWAVKDVVLHEQTEAKFMQEGLSYDDAHRRTVQLTGIS
jgi:hypothetical protein